MTSAFAVGYDPGGNGRHGLAVLEVTTTPSGYLQPSSLHVVTCETVEDVLRRVGEFCEIGKIVAAGVDTLTEWNTGPSGWRPADRWLAEKYRDGTRSILAPNGLRDSMVIGGAAFLIRLSERFARDRTSITEAHPKACYSALTGHSADWATRRAEMTRGILDELGVGRFEEVAVNEDHIFDACVAALAALRGRNGEWTLDLHALPDGEYSGRVRFCSTTHYWWPTDGAPSATC